MKHLSERQRYEIYGLIQAGFNQKGIAARLQFARHDVVSRELGVGFYFAHPYHSWERGSNENTNGLARQYLPKGSDFEHITDDYLEYVENMLNSRPRRRFGFRSPDEMFRKLTGLDGMMYV